MRLEWDENKSDACFADRGFDFAYVIRAFADPDRLLNRDHRWDYGEERYRLLARLTVGFSFWFTRPAMMSFGSYRPAKLTVERFRNMKKRQVTVDLEDIGSFPKGRVNNRRLDETSEEDLTFQQASDEAEAMDDAARFARRVRRRLGLTQLEFSVRINVSQETIRNWEQGKRCPTGAAKALLKVLDKAPEAALHALS
jgi:putative transcriptional regulator